MQAPTPIELFKLQSKEGRCLTLLTASEELTAKIVCIFPYSFNGDLIH